MKKHLLFFALLLLISGVMHGQETYTVTIVPNNGEYGSVSPTSVANVPYGTVITSNDNTLSVNGTTVTATPNPATAQYTYAFGNWSGIPATVTENVTITANFTQTANTYTVTIQPNNGDYGSVSPTSVANVPYGTVITQNGNTLSVNGTPVTATPANATDQYTYAFDNWSGIPATVTENVTITANFTQTANTYTVTIQPNNGDYGSVSPTSVANVPYGTVITQNGNTLSVNGTPVTATPNPATAQYTYAFGSWSGIPATVTENVTITANFTQTANTYTITIQPNNGEYGSVSPTSVANVPYGTVITQNGNTLSVNGTPVTATPNPATAQYTYAFGSWSGIPATVTENVTITANFTQTANTYTVTIQPNNGEYGSVSPTSVANVPYGTVITPDGSTLSVNGTTVTATPNEGYSFINWTANGTPIPSAGATVTGECNLVAHFSLNSYTITIVAYPDNGGTVAGGGNYTHGQSCTAVATPNPGYEFVNWTESGQEVSTNAEYSFTAQGNRTLVANFAQLNYAITVSANPAAGGTVAGGGSNFHYGDNCTVTATQATGYTFANWKEGNDVVSENASYTFQVTGHRNLVANFTLNNYEISVSANPTAGGNASGGGNYDHFSQCTVTATQATGYTFANWKEGNDVVSSNASYTFNVTGPHTLVANFTLNSYQITATAEPSNGGTATGSGTYNHFSQCTLTATPSTGYSFVNWTENGQVVNGANATYTFTVNGPRNLVAHFATNVYTIGASASPAEGGAVSGQGNYTYGQNCTLTAAPATGYAFVKWTKGSQQVSTNNPYTFTVAGGGNYVAHFQLKSYAITTSSNPSEGGTVSGGGTYNHGTTCTLTATPAEGYEFVKWTKNGQQVSTTTPYTFTVTGEASYVAHFRLKSYTITIAADPDNGGMVAQSGSGTYNHFSQCTLTATAATSEGYNFVRWTKNGQQVSTNPTYSFEVSGGGDYVAHFQLTTYEITATASPSNGGTVTGCGTYIQGQECPLTAVPANGYAFQNWTENGQVVSGIPNYTFTVTGPRTLVANFVVQQANTYNINVSASPSTGGTVSGGGNYSEGAECTVTATANTGHTFDNWTEGGTEVYGYSSYAFTVDRNRTLVAHFTAETYAIAATADPADGGTVSGGGTYSHGTTCTLTATANTGYEFVKWTKNGTQVSANPTYTFPVTAAGEYVAHFQKQRFTITVEANPEEGGSVTGDGTYEHGESCTLEASPNTGYEFVKWTKDGQQVSTDSTYTFTATGDGDYTAHFQKLHFTITVEANPEEGGTVTGGGTYEYGEICTVNAIPNEHYVFVNWTVDGEQVFGMLEYSFMVTQNLTLVANFIPDNLILISVEINPAVGGTATGAGGYEPGDPCTLRATARPGYTFVNWTLEGEEVSIEPTYIFTVSEPATYVAHFQMKSYEIEAKVNPTDGGTVSGDGIYTYGVWCTLEAMPNPGYSFDKWTKDGVTVGTNQSYTFQVTEDAEYIANFTQAQTFEITVTADPSNGGTVSGGGYYNLGAECSLEATPADAYRFDCWKEGDNVVSTDALYTFIVNDNHHIVAQFIATQYIITVVANPIQGGTVTQSGDGSYGPNDTITITASANPGYEFSHWQDDNTDNPRVIEVTGSETYTAYFTQLIYTITVSATEGGTASVIGNDTTFTYNQQCTVKAIPNDGYLFINWTKIENNAPVSVSTNESYTFSVTEDLQLKANFIEESCFVIRQIVPKNHTEGNDTYVLILIYPNTDPDTASYHYQWRFSSDGENYRNLTEGTYNKQYYYIGGALNNGHYKVLVKKDGCSREEETEAFIVENGHLRIYPNPSRRGNNIIVENEFDGPAQLVLYATDGRVLLNQMVTDSQVTLSINLPTGVYVARLSDKEGYTKIGKLIIQ